METALIVQARMGSTRLPGKILLEAAGKPLLLHQVERLRRVREADGIIIATTVNEADDAVAAFAAGQGLCCFRGSEDDVLGRFLGAAEAFGARRIVRVTADCPLLDPLVLDRLIRHFRAEEDQWDYGSNTLTRTYPRGLDAEIFPLRVLREAEREARSPAEREHVTPFIYRRPERYRLLDLRHEVDLSRHRWTVDTAEDFELVRNLLEELLPRKPRFGLADCLVALEAHPDWFHLNHLVEQKKT